MQRALVLGFLSAMALGSTAASVRAQGGAAPVTLTSLAHVVPAASQSADAPRPSNEWLAWKMGREYAFAEAWDMLNKSAESEKSLGFSRTFARALGISEPPPPSPDYMERVLALAKEVKAKYGEKIQYHFLVGVRLTDVWVGAAIRAEMKVQVANLALFLERSGIPPALWSTQLKAIQTEPSRADVTKLAQAIDEHLKR